MSGLATNEPPTRQYQQPPPAVSRKAHRRTGRQHRGPGGRVGLLFIGPNLLGAALFTIIPLAGVVGLAFANWDLVSGLGGIKIVGLDNFRDLLTGRQFWHAALRTLVYAGVAVPLSVLIGLALGIALNRDIPGRSLLRVIFFLPYIVNIVAVGMTWLMLMYPSAGLINQFLGYLGIDGPSWFASSQWALPALIVIAVWSHLGYAALIYVAVLQDMPGELYEAASIDGANAWKKFRVITWPTLLPTTFFLVVTVFVSVSQSFGLIALITSGGPGYSTTTLSYLMYEQAFKLYHFGAASAVGLMTFGFVIVPTILAWRSQRQRSLYA